MEPLAGHFSHHECCRTILGSNQHPGKDGMAFNVESYNVVYSEY